MANKKNKSQPGKSGKTQGRTETPDSNRNLDVDRNQVTEKTRHPIEPDPPQPNMIVLITSGVLMVGWMIFLLVMAIS